jgi:hypothetical protein
VLVIFTLAQHATSKLAGGGELGHGLGALRHGVLSKLTGQHQAARSLDLAARQGGLLVVATQAATLHSDALEHIRQEGVHHGHAALADAHLGVHRLQHLVDVGGIALHTAGLALAAGLLGLGGLGGLLAGSLRHFAEKLIVVSSVKQPF